MTDPEARQEPADDPEELRNAAVDALHHAARQSDPQEFNRLTRHALTLIERARAIGRGRPPAVSEAAETQASQKEAARPPYSEKIVKFAARFRRLFSRRSR
jgi:hypothetical protein